LSGLTRARPAWTARHALPAVLVGAVILAAGFQKVHSVASGVRSIGVLHVASGRTNLAADYALSIWIPTRALERRLDPYNPADGQVKRDFGNDVPAAFYTPAMLGLLAPISQLALPDAAEAMTALNFACLWLALWLLIKPRRPRDWAMFSVLGLATVYGYASENTLMLGQPTGLFLLGVAFLARAIVSDSFGALAVVGTSLLLLKPQYAIPTVAFLALLRQWRTIAFAVTLVALASVPFLVLEINAASGPIDALHALRANLSFFQHHDSGWGRTDLATLVTRGDPAALGVIGAVVLFLALLLVVYTGTRYGGTTSERGRIALVAVFAGFILASDYHPAYDVLILAVPAALGLASGKSIATRLLVLFAYIYVLLNFASRASFRYRIGGVFESTMTNQWPSIVALTALAVGMAVLVRTPRVLVSDTSAAGRY
jgi:Glycosyltransferase family 87